MPSPRETEEDARGRLKTPLPSPTNGLVANLTILMISRSNHPTKQHFPKPGLTFSMSSSSAASTQTSRSPPFPDAGISSPSMRQQQASKPGSQSSTTTKTMSKQEHPLPQRRCPALSPIFSPSTPCPGRRLPRRRN